MKIFLTSLALLACASPAFTQGTSPRFVRLGDLNTSPVIAEPTSGGAAYAFETGGLVFSGSDSEAGEEIWIKPSYSAHARRLMDFRPGGASSMPREFASLGSRRFSVVVDDGITGPEVVVLDLDGHFFTYDSGQDLCPGRDHAAPRFLGRVSGKGLYVLDDGVDPFGRPGESVWQFSGGVPPLWLETFKAGSVRQPQYGNRDELYFVGQRWDEAEIALFRVSWLYSNQAELLCVLGEPAVAEPLPQQVYAVTPWMVCYRGFTGSQPVLRAFRTNDPGNVVSYPLGPAMIDPSFTSNGYDRICYTGYHPLTGLEPWMIVDDLIGSPLTPELVVDSNPSTSSVTASHFAMQGNILYFETGSDSRVLKFVDTSLSNRVAYTILADSERISHRQPVSLNQLAYVVTSGGSDSILLYNTTSRTSQSLAQNVQLTDLWGQGDDLNAIIDDNGYNDTFYRLAGTSWVPVQSFTAGSARPLQVNGDENSTTGWLIASTYGNDEPQLFHYPLNSSVSASYVTMNYEGPSNNASSHPADFHEIDGHLFLTAIKDGQRVLFHSPDGAQDSLQPVPLDSSGEDFAVGELVKLGNQLFLRSAVDGTLCRALVEPAPVGAVVRPVLDGASLVPSERLTVAAGKVFFVQSDATTETLRYLNPDLTLGTVQVFQNPTAGKAITQMTGTPDRLFFAAPRHPGQATSPITLWSTTGSGVPSSVDGPFNNDAPNILGTWSGQCVVWYESTEATHWELFTWSGGEGQGLHYHWGDNNRDRRPDSSRTPGFPSGIEFDGRFAFCTREGGLRVLGPSGGTEFQWNIFVRPECLATLNGKLVWKAYKQRYWQSALWENRWSSWSAGGGLNYIGLSLGPASPLCAAAGRVWSVAGSSYHTVLRSWNGLANSFQEHVEPVDPYELFGDASLGSYRGRLLLSARPDFVAHSGYEPTLLLENSAPAAPVPLKRTGTRPGQPFTFTYADLLTWGITDADGDPFSLAALGTPGGLLKVNGSTVSGHLPLNPGDLFEWTPSTGEVGDVPAFQLRASDTWDHTDIPVIIRVETPHDEWTRLHFTPTQLADPLVSGPQADADGDGTNNALEFLFGRLPQEREGEAGWSLTSTTPSPGQRRAVFTFKRLAVLPPGTQVIIEQSDDLLNWGTVAEKLQNAAWTFPVTGVSVEEMTLPDGRIETRVAVDENSSLNGFLRLRLVLP